MAAPDPPTDVEASSGLYPDKIKITWDAPVDATHSKVYRDDEAITGWIEAEEFDNEGDSDVDTGATSPGTMADDDTVGNTAWVNPDNAKASDNSYATVLVGAVDEPPFDAIVKLLKAGVVSGDNKATCSELPSPEEYVSYGGSDDLWGLILTPSDINSANFGVVFGVSVEGGCPEVPISHYLKATNFGFSIPSEATINGILVEIECRTYCSAPNCYAYVDHIRITVYYSVPAPGAPAISPGAAAASKNRYFKSVRAILASESLTDGTEHTYKVKCKNADGESDFSDTDTGYRAVTGISYQWQRSAADSDADYSDLLGAVETEHFDYGAPDNPAGRYYRCKLVPTGLEDIYYSIPDRGYRRDPSLPPVEHKVSLLIKDSTGDTLAYIVNASEVTYKVGTNQLSQIEFRLPYDEPSLDYLIEDNEIWLSIDRELKDILKITRKSADLKSSTINFTARGIGIVLTKSIVNDGYSVAIGAEKKPSDILTALLAYQEVEEITFGGVDPALDSADIAINISDGVDVWAACKVVKDTVGGYLQIEIDPDDPSTRELWLRDSLGEDKGQRITLEKNLVSGEHNTDYSLRYNRLYPLGSGIKLDDESFTRVDVDKSSDASYGYLKIRGLYSAYKGWTGEGDALPVGANAITIETPTGAWTSPTGHDASPFWVEPERAYDGLFATESIYYQAGGLTGWLTLTFPAVDSTQIYLYHAQQDAMVEVEIYYGAAWHQVQSLTWPPVGGMIITFGEQNITKMRIRYETVPAKGYARIWEVKVWDSTGWTNVTADFEQGEDEETVRCDIGDYDADAGYVISYTHAPYLIDLADITDRKQIKSISESFSTDDIDELFLRARTRLPDLEILAVDINPELVELYKLVEGYDFDEIQLGSLVRLVQHQLEIDEEFRIVSIRYPDLLHPGSFYPMLSSQPKTILDLL